MIRVLRGELSRARRRSERGAALIELAVALPVLAIVLVGAIDFGRVFRLAMIVENAARAGAMYGAQDSAHAVDAAGMRLAGGNVLTANGLIALNAVTAAPTCECANNSGGFSPRQPTAYDCSGASTCPGGTHLVVRVTVTATKTFSMTSAFLGLPTNVTIARTATMVAFN